MLASVIVLYHSLGDWAGLGQGHTTAGRYQKGWCPPVHNLGSYPLLLPTNWIGAEAGLFRHMIYVLELQQQQHYHQWRKHQNNKHWNDSNTVSLALFIFQLHIVYPRHTLYTLRAHSATLFGISFLALRLKTDNNVHVKESLGLSLLKEECLCITLAVNSILIPGCFTSVWHMLFNKDLNSVENHLITLAFLRIHHQEYSLLFPQ